MTLSSNASPPLPPFALARRALCYIGLSASQSGMYSATTSTAASSVKGGSANSKTSSQIATISREELKQALLSVMSRKDELQEQCLSLKKLLDFVVQTSEALKE